jgi:hypothetical protein
MSPSSHLRTETDPVAETLYVLVIKIPDDGHLPNSTAVHHHQNPLDSRRKSDRFVFK